MTTLVEQLKDEVRAYASGYVFASMDLAGLPTRAGSAMRALRELKAEGVVEVATEYTPRNRGRPGSPRRYRRR